MENDFNLLPLQSKPTSQFSFEDCPPFKTESFDQMSFQDERKVGSPNFRRNLPKPKTEIFMNTLVLEKECSEEEMIPILERCKKRESTFKSNPFSNLTRFSSKTWIMNNSLHNEQSPVSPYPEKKPKEFLKLSLQSHFLFKEWDPFLLEKLISELRCVPLKKTEVLLDKTTPIRSFYIIAKGLIQLKGNNNILEEQKIGDLLCVSSIFQNLESGYEVSALEDSTLWGVEFVKFQEILKNNAYSALQENRKFLDKIQYFDNLSNENKVEIAFYLKTEKYSKTELNEKNWETCDHLFIVKSGSLKAIFKQNEADSKEILIKENEVFGEDKYGVEPNIQQLLVDESCEEVILLSICKSTLRLILGTQYIRMVHVHELRILMKRSDFLVALDPITKEKIIRKLKVSEAKKGDVLWENNAKKLIFLLKGELRTENDQPISKNIGIFNEEELFHEKPSLEFQKLIMESDGFYAEISFEKFAQILKTSSIQEYFILLKNALKKDSFEIGSPISPFIHIKSMSNALKNSIKEIRTHQKYEIIKILKEIGDGQFGLVLLAKIAERFFALKVISRFWIMQNQIEDYLVNEKKICRIIDSPFIIHLDFTFRDQYNIYFLFEYIDGIDLFKFMNISGRIPTNLAQFYAANLILAIEYLHNKNIIHRDLKPENIMISKNGYLKVIDLGAAKLFTEENHEMLSSKSSTVTFQKPDEEQKSENNPVPLLRTFTLIGTPEYLAPETIRGTGYHFPVDLWALGVIIFEMLCGFCPFGHNKTEPIEIYQSILEDELKFPKFMKDSKARKLIRQLLSKSPEERSEGSFNALKAKKWFDDIKWNEIAALKTNAPPYIPEANKEAEREIQELLEKNITLKYVLEKSSLEDLKKQAEIGGFTESASPGWDEIF